MTNKKQALEETIADTFSIIRSADDAFKNGAINTAKVFLEFGKEKITYIQGENYKSSKMEILELYYRTIHERYLNDKYKDFGVISSHIA